MVSIWLLTRMNVVSIRKYKPRNITIKPISAFKQTDANCWIYSVLNNLYLNTGIKVDDVAVKRKITDYWLNVYGGNNSDFSAAILCEFLKDKKIKAYKLDILKNTKLFAELLKAGYSFVYTRDCHNNVLQDIADNNQIDDIVITKGMRHAVNIKFMGKKLREYGSRWSSSRYNEFDWGTTDVFIKSVKAWAVSSEVIFLDFKQ